MAKCSGNLYQLRGDVFLSNGPHDTYGKILNCIEKTQRGYLYLIRGVEKRAGETPKYNF